MLCEHCYEESEQFEHHHRLHLGAECDAPIDTGDDAEFIEDFALTQVRSAARALLKNTADKIPASRVAELTALLKTHYAVDELTQELLLQGSNCGTM